MNISPFPNVLRGIWYLALAIPVLMAGDLAPHARALEYEVAGEYSFQKRMFFKPEVLKQYDEFVKQQTAPGETPKRSRELQAEFERLRGVKVHEDQGMQPMAASRRKFHLFVRDQAWLMRIEAPEAPLPYVVELGSSGTREIYQSFRSTNGATAGSVYLRTVPHSFVGEVGPAIVWMMCASSHYLDGLTNNLVWPVHHPYANAIASSTNFDASQPARLERVETIPRLPSRLSFFDSFQKLTNVVYATTGWTNVGKLTLPTAFYWEKSNGIRHVDGKPQNFTVERMDVTVRMVSPSCSRKDLKPTVYAGMGVGDRRLKQPEEYVRMSNGLHKGYILSGKKWVSQAEAQDLVDGRKRRPWLWIVAGAGTICVFGLAVWWLRRSRWGGGIIPRS